MNKMTNIKNLCLMMKNSRWMMVITLSLLIIHLSFSPVKAQDVTLQVTPVQSVLPPQAGKYIDNLGRYFRVTVINNTSVSQSLYFGVQIQQKFPSDVLWMSTNVETMHIPQQPIVLAPNQHKTLNSIELKHLFDHFGSHDIFIREGRYKNILDSEFGLLDEGQYELHLTAYEWNTQLTSPVVLTSPLDGVATFNICYEAEPPMFTFPIRPVVTDGLSDLAITKIDKKQAQIRFEWTQPTLNCNATMVNFRYRIRFVELGSMMPDEAMEENTPTFLEKHELLTNSYTIPTSYVTQMIADTAAHGKVYAMQVTAYTPYQNSNSLNVALVKNEGKSDIFLFQLYDPEKEDKVIASLGDNEISKDERGEPYIYEQPILTHPVFSDMLGRFIYSGDSIKAEWRHPAIAGGWGEKQDTVKFKYNLALYIGNAADNVKTIFKTSKPVFTKDVGEKEEYTIKWVDLQDKVSQGDYLLLRVTAKCTNNPDSIVKFKSDSLNYTDFALTRHFDETYQCGRNTATVGNKELINEKPKAGTRYKIGQWNLELIDDASRPLEFDKDKKTLKGFGRIEWSVMKPKAYIAVKFDSLKVNTDGVVFDGVCKTYSKSSQKVEGTEYTEEQVIDSLFSSASLDNIFGALSVPENVRNAVTGYAKDEATNLAKSYNLGKYYTQYKKAENTWENWQKGDLGDLYFPFEAPDEIKKYLPKDFSLQIGNITFSPSNAVMNLIGAITLPNSDIFEDQNVLVFGAPRLCISPDRFFPEDGVLALLSNFVINDPSSDFKLVFKAPSEPLNPTLRDGCFIRWENDEFDALGMEIAMTIPNTTRVVDGKPQKDVPALLDLWTTIEAGGSACDFIAEGTMTSFQVNDLPDWTFTAGKKIVFDHHLDRNGKNMPDLKTVEGWTNNVYDLKKVTNYNSWEAWQGVFIDEVSVQFPKWAVIGNGEQGITVGGQNMIFDASGATAKFFAKDVLDAETGRCGGWKFSIEEANVQIVQNNFDNCTFKGGIGVPLLGKVAQEKAGDNSSKKGDGKGGSGSKDGGKSGSNGKTGGKDGGKDGGKGAGDKTDEESRQESDIDYFCQIRNMTDPELTEKYYTYEQKYDGAGNPIEGQFNKIEHERKKYYNDKARYGYVFTTENASNAKLGLNFFIADMTLLPGQTYFLVEAIDTEKDGEEDVYTQVELCLAGDITIAGIDNTRGVKSDTEKSSFAKRVEEINNSLPLPLVLPGIHFAKMRLSNRALDDWKNLGVDQKNHHDVGLASQDAWLVKNKVLYTFTEGKEIELGKECYFNYGEWSLASAEKKLGPFTFTLKEFKPDMKGDTISLDVEGQIGLMDGKFAVGAGIRLSAQAHTQGSISDWYVDDGKVNFKSFELNVDWEVFKFKGRLELEDSSTDKGYGGNINLEIKDLFKLDVAGGYYNHKGISEEEKTKKIADAKLRAKNEDGSEAKYKKYYNPDEDFYSWGYFLATVGGQGLRIDPIVINRITGGFYYNCRPAPGKKDKDGHYELGEAKPTAAYGTIGVVFGLGITTSGGEETIKGDLDMVVIYDKKNSRMSHLELNGELEAVGGIIHSKASLIYENNDADRYLCMNLTVHAGLDSDELANNLTAFSNELKAIQEELNEFQSQVDDFVMKKPRVDEMKANMAKMQSEYEKTTSEEDKEKSEKEVSDGAKKAKTTYGTTDIYVEFKVTYREKGTDKSPTKWHLYLGEPQKDKRCKFTTIDYKDDLDILSVKIESDAYLCIGNELPGNGQLPAIPSEITEFLNGHKNSAVSTGGDMEKVNNARSQVVKKMLQNAGTKGGIMVGASSGGFINVELGIFYGYMKALGGFDVSLVKYDSPQYCSNYGDYMGYKGWYAMGQLYAYLAAKLGLHIKLGSLIDEKVDLVDAGIGGLLSLGLPKPTWIEGQARVKVNLLGGLVKVDKGFNFSAGSKCVPFKGNALDDFSLFGDVTVASDSIQEGWDEANAISLKDAKNIQFSTYANLGERYRLYDPTTGGDLSKETGYSEEQMSLYASRTYIFDINKDRVLTENSGATTNIDLGAKLYEIPTDATIIVDNYMYKLVSEGILTGTTSYKAKPFDDKFLRNFYKKADGSGLSWNNAIMSRWMEEKDLTSREKAFPEEFKKSEDFKKLDQALLNVIRWEGYDLKREKESSSWIEHEDGVGEIIKPYLVPGGAKINESTGRNFHLTLSGLKPGKLYILELNGQAFEVLNGKRVWTNMTVTTHKKSGEEEKHDEYVRWEQKRLVFFRTKTEEEEQEAIPENLTDIQPYVALAYPSAPGNKLFQDKEDGATYKANIVDIQRPTIALNTDISSSFSKGKLEWILQGYSTGMKGTKAIATQKIENEFVRKNGGVNMQPKEAFDLSKIQESNTEDNDYQILLKYTYPVYKRTAKVVKGYEGADGAFGIAMVYAYTKGMEATWDALFTWARQYDGWEAIDVDKEALISEIDNAKSEQEKGDVTYYMLGLITGENTSDCTISDDFTQYMASKLGLSMVDKDIYEDATVNLANMWFRCNEEPSWHLGRRPLTSYEKQFVGIRPENLPTFAFSLSSDDNNYTKLETKQDGLLMRLADPYLYFAYLSKYVFINDVALDNYDFDDVNVPHASESLTFSFNGHGISGSLIPGDNYRNKKLYTLRNEMYSTWKNAWYYTNYGYYSDLKWPLPLYADEDLGLTANNQTFISQPYNKFNIKSDSYYVGNTPFRQSDFSTKGYAAKYLAQQFTAPYYIAQALSDQMKKIATQVYNITKSSTSDSEVNKAMIDWQNLHRGQYLRVSSMGFEVQVPYYQFPLILGDCFDDDDRAFKKSIVSKVNDIITTDRNDRRTSNLYFFRLMGGTPLAKYDPRTYPGIYNSSGNVNQDWFSAASALKMVTKFDYRAYRTNTYNLSTNRYEYSEGIGNNGRYGSTYPNTNFTGALVNTKDSKNPGTYASMDKAMSTIGTPAVYINGLIPVPFVDTSTLEGLMMGGEAMNQMFITSIIAPWMQDHEPDLYAIYKESSNTKKIGMLQAWAAANDPTLTDWASKQNKGLWWVLIWKNDPALIKTWKMSNSVNKALGKPATFPETEPTFQLLFFKDIISHKYGIIW